MKWGQAGKVITIDDNFATLLGYTHEELLRYFKDRLETLAQKLLLPGTTILENLIRWYNGYSIINKNKSNPAVDKIGFHRDWLL